MGLGRVAGQERNKFGKQKIALQIFLCPNFPARARCSVRRRKDGKGSHPGPCGDRLCRGGGSALRRAEVRGPQRAWRGRREAQRVVRLGPPSRPEAPLPVPGLRPTEPLQGRAERPSCGRAAGKQGRGFCVGGGDPSPPPAKCARARGVQGPGLGAGAPRPGRGEDSPGAAAAVGLRAGGLQGGHAGSAVFQELSPEAAVRVLAPGEHRAGPRGSPTPARRLRARAAPS